MLLVVLRRDEGMIRQIATLLSGNVLSQLVNVGTILFVVTAFFSPAEFGRYAVLMSYVGILSAVACLRYELSIVSVGRQYVANNMIFSSVAIATIYSAAVFIVLKMVELFAGSGFLLGTSVATIVALVYLKAIDQVCASVLYRHESYLTYSILKLLQALVLLGAFASTGAAGQGLDGLLWSTMIAYATFAAAGLVAIRQYDLSSGVQLNRMLALAKRHADFVKFNTPHALIDNSLANGINFVLIALAGSSVVGYFSYMQKILKAPLGLVFGAVSQVVFRFSARNIGNPELVVHKLRQVLAIIASILLITVVAVGLVYVILPKLEFLRDWSGLRDYMIAFAVWMLVPFLFSSFAALPVVYGRQKTFFQVATTFNLLSLAALAFIIWSVSVTAAFWTIGLGSVAYFLSLNAWVFRIAGSGQKG